MLRTLTETAQPCYKQKYTSIWQLSKVMIECLSLQQRKTMVCEHNTRSIQKRIMFSVHCHLKLQMYALKKGGGSHLVRI